MRSPGVVYRRYRQIKKKILYDNLSEARKCLHCNCHYGKEMVYKEGSNIERTIKICMYGQTFTEGNIEICTNPYICNAYVNKWNKDKVIEAVDKMLSDHETKKKLYPELTMLEWVLDKDLNDAIKNPGFFGTIIVKCIEFLESILRNK